MPNHIVLSVDFELFSDTFAFQKLGREWMYKENGETGIEKLLELFEKYKVKSTFFVVARLARTHEELLKRIRDNGHEIASHTVTHIPFSNCISEETKVEIKDSKRMLEKAINEKVIGFRAPAFKIDAQIMKRIEQSGYKYDSSVVPCWNIPGWYGSSNTPLHPFNVQEIYDNINSKFIEFPLAVNPIIRMPISGAWMRLFGIRYTMIGIKSLLKKGAIPVLYVHPWELVNLERIKGIPWRVYYRTGKQTSKMVEHIIKNVDAKFVSIRDLLETGEMEG